MKQHFYEKGIPAIIGMVGSAVIVWWVVGFLRGPEIEERDLGVQMFAVRAVPGGGTVSNLGPGSEAAPGSAAVSFRPSATTIPVLPGLWPEFRGPDRNGVSPEPTKLERQWAAQGPPVLWEVSVGAGYAAPAVRDGRVYLLDYDKGAKADAVRCFALSDGRELWRRSYPVVVKPNHGMSRTIPAVTDTYVVTLGPKCHLVCTKAKTGDIVWRHDLVAEMGVTVPEWYAGECPVIADGAVIVGTGGRALVVAFDLATGKVRWETPNPRGWVMTHSSVLPVTIAGTPTYVYCGSGGVAGVAAKDGKLLWETLDWVVSTATVPTPVDIGDGRLFLSGGYDAGAMMFRVEKAGASWSVRSLYRLKSSVFGSEQHTPILYKGSLYGVRSGGQLVCLDLDGKERWASGNLQRFGLGPYVIADGMVIAMDDNGTLSAIEAVPDGYRLLAQAKVLSGPEAWAPLAIAGGRLLARDMSKLICLDLARR